jgi:DNA-binding winged helix-turn-helix (wHTH) protein
MLRFGRFTLDVKRCELRRGGQLVSLQPKVFALLAHLVQHRDRVVTRAELFADVWPGVFVGQSSLNRAVRELRRTLGDDEKDPSYVATLPRRGYRFIASVSGGRPSVDPRTLKTRDVLLRVAAAHTFDDLSAALSRTGEIVGAHGTILCRYSPESAIGTLFPATFNRTWRTGSTSWSPFGCGIGFGLFSKNDHCTSSPSTSLRPSKKSFTNVWFQQSLGYSTTASRATAVLPSSVAASSWQRRVFNTYRSVVA